MIVNGALNGATAVQPFVMQQVMQIQDPNTGQIQTGSELLLFQTLSNIVLVSDSPATATTIHDSNSVRSKFEHKVMINWQSHVLIQILLVRAITRLLPIPNV